jgi:lipopolysaccharide/colanic/teichoic acid biosynthesis glycosyltransferase
MKRVVDLLFSIFGLILLSPVLIIFIILIYFEDGHYPFYIARRIGKNGVHFKMIKLRSMVINADKSGVDSTSITDSRITNIGQKVRKFKLDEFTQLWNVLLGHMSLVGPRPNVQRDTDLYTDNEKELLSVRPGITDFSSIVFSDEGDILKGYKNPDLAYNQLIRPWKSRLGLIYIENQTTMIDLKLIFYTILAIISKKRAIKLVVYELIRIGVDPILIKVSKREESLYPYPPPGQDKIVVSR